MSAKDPGYQPYGWTDLLKIADLASQPMLREDRRQPGPNQTPVGQYWSGHAWVVLYRASAAVDMPPLSPGRQRQYDRARTCAGCGGTWKTPVPKGRDGERYCATCQEPAAERLWQRERAADRAAASVWASSVLADPNVVLAAKSHQQYWTTNLVVDLTGAVLLDAEIRHYGREPYDDSPQREALLQRSPLAVIDQIEALRGRRLIAWHADGAPALATSFDEYGNPVAHAARVERDDAFGRWYDRWVGEMAGSVLHHPYLRPQQNPREPAECVAKMRELLTEMAAGPADQGATETAPNASGLDR